MNSHSTLVLGASGFIGGRLAAFLRASGETVRGYGSRDCDLLNEADVKRQFADVCGGANLVFCPAISRVDDDSRSALQKNLAMVNHLAAAACRQQPRCLVFLSSTDVYGMPAATSPIREATAPRPDTYYGVAKLAAEGIWNVASGRRFPAIHLRLPGVFGDGDQGRSVVSSLRDRIQNGETIRLTNRGETLRDYLHVEDVCQVVGRILKEPRSVLLNVATGHSRSLRDICQSIAEELGVEPRLEHSEKSEARDHDLVFDVSGLTDAVGPLRFLSLEEGLRR